MNVSNTISINLEQSFETNYNQKVDLKAWYYLLGKNNCFCIKQFLELLYNPEQELTFPRT